MELFRNLFEGYPNLWGGGVAHSVLILSLVIAFGIMLGKIKVAGISLGVTWILFVGIVFGHFNLNLDEHLLHFLKEFGLILFVYSVGLQVGPGFFSAFKKGGFTLNMLAMMVVFLGVVITVTLHFITGVPITTMVGILSGAVTNTPGLGAAQQANSDNNDAGLTNDGDEIFPMAFPTESGDPKLCGGIWGFGIFDNGAEAKIEAAKTFIDFIAADPDQVKDSVLASTYFPVRTSVGDIYADNEIMSEYSKFMAYLGDYYQITPGWATARTEWWNMLQRVGSGEDVESAVKTFVDNANAAAQA